MDLFREWDEDNNGHVTRKEFNKAMRLLGFEVADAEIDLLFDSWDPNGSGVLEFPELNEQLRRGAEVILAHELQDGAAGVIETERPER